eukprot:COSAG02_NODE_1222_length_13800_cov_66.755565_14_plen_369_part_00
MLGRGLGKERRWRTDGRMAVTLELVAMARGSDGAPLARELQLPLLARSVRRQLLGHTLKVGDRQAATVLGRQREFDVVEVSAGAAHGRVTVGEDTDVQLRGHSSTAAQSSPDVASPRSSWHREASAAMPMTPALADACDAAWCKELGELSDQLRMVMAVRGAAQLPLGISRGVLLQAASGGGKTMLLRYFMRGACAGSASRVPPTAVDVAQKTRADRLSRLSRRAAAVCDNMPPFSVVAFSGMDVHTGRAPASGQGDSLVSFLAHASASSKQTLLQEKEGHDPAALLVWLDDLDVLLAAEPGGDGDADSVPVDALTARRQLLAWMSQLPHNSNIVVVGSVTDAAITAKAVPGLVSAGAYSSRCADGLQ